MRDISGLTGHRKAEHEGLPAKRGRTARGTRCKCRDHGRIRPPPLRRLRLNEAVAVMCILGRSIPTGAAIVREPRKAINFDVPSSSAHFLGTERIYAQRSIGTAIRLLLTER